MFSWLEGDDPPRDPCPARFQLVDVTEEPGHVIVRVYGELDLITTPQLTQFLQTRLDHSPAKARFVVDLSVLDFLAATGLRALINAAHAAQARGAQFSVIGCRPFVLRIIDIVGARATLHAHGAAEAT